MTNRTKKGRKSRRNSLSGGVPLEPIYETNEPSESSSSPLEEYMSGTIMTHIQNNNSSNNNNRFSLPPKRQHDNNDNFSSSFQAIESQFHIIADNASTHPEFTGSKQGRWGNGDDITPQQQESTKKNLSNDSNSSINTNSTSSLTLSLYDCEDDDKSIGSFEETPDEMSPREIIDKATDVVDGKYDYNSNSNSGRRKQTRRSSLPMMPIRQNSVSNFDLPPKPSKNHRSTSLTSPLPQPPSSLYQSNHSLESSKPNNVALDKFGVPIRNKNNSNKISYRRKPRERRSSMPSRAGSCSSSSDVPRKPSSTSSLYDYSETKSSIDVPPKPHSTSSIYDYSSETKSECSSFEKLDKFGIPFSHNEGGSSRNSRRSIDVSINVNVNVNVNVKTGRKKQGRRSSTGDDAKSLVRFEPTGYCPGLLDKHGVPLRPASESLSSSSTHSRSSSNKNSSSSSSSTGRKRQGRRSSMPTRYCADEVTSASPAEPMGFSPGLVDKYGVPIRPSHDLTSRSTHSCSSNSKRNGRRRQGRRSSMGDATASVFGKASVSLEQFSISAHSRLSVDKFGIPIRPALVSSSIEPLSGSTHSCGHMAQSTPSRSVSFQLPPPAHSSSSEDSLQEQSGSVLVDKFGIPIWPKQMISNSSSSGGSHNSTGRRRRQERRSSLPTTSSFEEETSPVLFDKYVVPVNSNSVKQDRPARRGRRPSMPTVSTQANSSNNACSASAMRFFPEEFRIPGRNCTNNNEKNETNNNSIPIANGAPIRPVRIPSEDSFGSKKKNALAEVAQPNASFDVVVEQQPNKKSNNQKKLESMFLRSTNDDGAAVGDTLDKEFLGPKSRWGANDADAKGGLKKAHPSDASVNTFQQKEGEWWW